MYFQKVFVPFVVNKIVYQQRQSHLCVCELEASEMSAVKQISQRVHESSNKTVSNQAAAYMSQAKTLLQNYFQPPKHTGDCCYVTASLSW